MNNELRVQSGDVLAGPQANVTKRHKSENTNCEIETSEETQIAKLILQRKYKSRDDENEMITLYPWLSEVPSMVEWDRDFNPWPGKLQCMAERDRMKERKCKKWVREVSARNVTSRNHQA